MQFAQLKPGPAFSPLHCILYYAQRLVIFHGLRSLIASGLCAAVRAHSGVKSINRQSKQTANVSLDNLKSAGLTELGMLFTKEQLTEIHQFLNGKTLKANEAGSASFTLQNVPAGVRMGDYGLGDILDCPHIVQLANNPALLALVTKYIGCKPTLSAIGLRWSFPIDAKGEGLQAFHRDLDDWRFLKVFVYLTDVSEDCGPHVYVKGTHRTRAPLRLRQYSDAEVETTYGANRCTAVMGPAGFAFAADTYGIHKGLVPTRRPRLLLQLQYSILPVYMYHYQPLSYKAGHQFDRYVNRLIFQ